ncbi:uncharacterized protein LOC111014866 [Momordica charantia]|uniref:Uncharacterized protein LOC111014866 n=1 Tax=Momordica charantia TaxID=3673 RepID=A0A6J1CW96_MOMCH|nr:uncharacterized protein LOC111014866 [Momordica charantia]
MGCFSACFCFKSTETAKLLDSDGSLIGKVKLPVKAAELMLEKPGHVISPVEELRRTSRISALRADDELVGGKVYMVVAVGRVGSKFSMAELENIELACKNRGKKNGSKVLPEAAGTAEEKEEIGGGIVCGSDQLGGYCRVINKRWNPNLESICEDFSHSFRDRH